MTAEHTLTHVKDLGQRLLPGASRAHTVRPAPPRPVRRPAAPQHGHALEGMGAGVSTVSVHAPNTGTAYHLEGAGTFGTLGVVTVIGNIHGVGLIRNTHALGRLTLANGRGSVTIQVVGPAQDSFETLPEELDYRITGGTGAYRGLDDAGTIHLRLTSTSASASAPGLGVFTMSLGG